MVVPAPKAARRLPPAPCEPVAGERALGVCTFGAPPGESRANIALVGDSHAMHWRAAADHMARAEGWRGISIAMGGCPYSTATRDIWEPLRSQCAERNTLVPGWFERHPEVSTVLFAQIAGVQWVLPRGTTQFEGQVRNYLRAWSRLPASVTRLIVIRDTPKAARTTHDCIRAAMAAGDDAGRKCRVTRRRALPRDPAVEAASRMRSRRVQVVDLTRYFCDRRWCYPVIGGALVQKDNNHLTPVFMETMGPYLRRSVRALTG